MQRLDNAGNSVVSIREPVPTKEMWGGVQDVCWTIPLGSRTGLFRDMLEEIMECGTLSTPLHPKITAWHADSKRKGEELPFSLDDVIMILYMISWSRIYDIGYDIIGL
jgi:hypothetical protein